ncbi:hypothetical protein [Nocardia sp. NBC_00565]|uniref:hypothetical protein n=1 Tax=Nocardia sp. NBC_00565 TaxID=2975993 RepID=UPI003FA57F15
MVRAARLGLRPRRVQILAQSRDVLDDDHQLVPHYGAHRRKATLGNRSGRDIDGLWRRDALVNLCSGVDFDTQTGCQLLDRGTPGRYQDPGPQQHRPVVERFAEPMTSTMTIAPP